MRKEQEAVLEQLPPGARAVVAEFRGGSEFTSRLAGLGISVGCQIEVLQNPAHGPLLLLVRDTRVALGHGEAAKILVRKSAGGQP